MMINVTCLQPLPKQMAMAKLLKSEQISGIKSIKYRNAYKILIEFDNREQADKLLNNKKFKDLDYKCELTYETTFTYGLIRGIELEASDEEILAALSSEIEITAIRRLKKLNSDGKWVNSESIRLCFNSSILPESVKIYDCNFKVEKYIFPVTQCSVCWKFGHIAKFCPKKIILCPKCGNDHPNCNTDSFKCLNCKGPHMALDKSCPSFIKEKTIRKIMSDSNVTYRIALETYMKDKKNKAESNNITQDFYTNTTTRRDIQTISGKTYSEVVSSQPIIHKESHLLDKNDSITMNQVKNKKCQQNKPKTNVSNEKYNFLDEIKDYSTSAPEEYNTNMEVEEEEQRLRYEKKKEFEWKRFLLKLKNIIMSNDKLEEKIWLCLKVICEEVKILIFKYLPVAELLNIIFKTNNG